MSHLLLHSCSFKVPRTLVWAWSTVNLSKIWLLFCADISRAPKPSDLLSPSELISNVETFFIQRLKNDMSNVTDPSFLKYLLYFLFNFLNNFCTHISLLDRLSFLYHNHANITGEWKSLLQHLVVSRAHKGNIFPTALLPYPAILSNCLLH